MTSILILALEDDLHATAIQWGLVKAGHRVHRMSEVDFPKRRQMSLKFSGSRQDMSYTYLNESVDFSSFDVVWRRRAEPCQIDEVNIHIDDQDFVRAEARAATIGWREISGLSDAVWVNPAASAERAKNKPFQLRVAQQCGLKIPETLISNNPDDIRHFVKGQKGGAIYKTLTPGTWTDGDDTLITFVNRVTDDMLKDDMVLSVTPGIYQGLVDKAYELRANIFGHHIVATRINNQGSERTALDWRPNVYETSLDMYQLPSAVECKLLEFMARTGLVYGAVDILCDTNGNYIFLEVNQAGQFLWIDDMLPEANLFGTMVGFLGGGGENKADAQPVREGVRFRDFQTVV